MLAFNVLLSQLFSTAQLMVVDTIQALATSVEKLLLHAGWGHAIVVVVLAMHNVYLQD